MKVPDRSGDRAIARDRVIGKTEAIGFSSPLRPRGEAARSSDLCATGTVACANVSFLRTQAPAGVPVPHGAGDSRFNLPKRCLAEDEGGLRAVRQVSRRPQTLWQVILAALREIFDESAYDRFLVRTQDTRSVESYRAFLRERETAIARKPRCC